MTIRDGQPSPAQAKMMAKVFVIATLLGGLVVFLNVSMRSYNMRLQMQAEKEKAAAAGTAAPGTTQQTGQVATPDAGQPAPGTTQPTGQVATPDAGQPAPESAPGSAPQSPVP